MGHKYNRVEIALKSSRWMVKLAIQATERKVITVETSADQTGAQRLGFEEGQVIQEFGWDDDVDDKLREDIEDITKTELADEDYGDVSDAAIIWWRAEDGDLTDVIVDALTVLDDGGSVWVFTPKPGRENHVNHSDIQEAATTSGLNVTSTFGISTDWSATRLATRGRGK